MSSLLLSNKVIEDLNSFISSNYPNYLPNSLLIAQAFILKYQNYGKEFGLTVINKAIEDGIKQGLFVAHLRQMTHGYQFWVILNQLQVFSRTYYLIVEYGLSYTCQVRSSLFKSRWLALWLDRYFSQQEKDWGSSWMRM
jgi:hypothetical protein